MYTKRVGFAILPEELQTNLRVIQQHTLLCTDPCYQYGMIAALEDEASPAQLTDVYRSRAEYTTRRLAGTGCEPIAAEGGFYAMLRCKDWSAARGFASSKELARDILNKVHVAVVPGTDFGSSQAQAQLMLGSIYVLFGMAILSMCFSLMQDEIIAKVRWIGQKVGLLDKNDD